MHRDFVRFLLLAPALFAWTACAPSGGFPVRISERQINLALAKEFPVSQPLLGLFKLTYENPHVTLPAGSDRVHLALDASLTLSLLPGAKTLSGKCLFESGIRYDPGSASFFLADPEIRKLEIQGLPQDQVDRVTQAALQLGQTQLEATPIYTLDTSDPKLQAAQRFVKDVRIKDGAVEVLLGL
jgi:hypothetical protein